MKTFFAFGLVLFGGTAMLGAAARPLALHPDNPHYFLFRGKPTILITSGEHYGAVLNLDFDYVKYLETLAKDKLNHTRVWTGGPYLEPQGAFNIARNTLAPAPNRLISPYARSQQPGFAGGGNRFDLTRWDEAYFKRLHDFMRHAAKRGIVVEMNLFCPMYEEKQWKLSPYNFSNNINGLGNVGRHDLFTLDKHGGLLAIEETMTRKFVEELKGYDNLFFEVINEPYATGVPMNWQEHIAQVIADAQKTHRHPKLISLNIANNSAVVKKPHPAISIFNFHYATPPNAVAMNYPLNKAIGDNETGFRGTNDAPYRMEAWDFLLAGGGLYNNLDYSFTAGHEDGTFLYPATQPGGGSPGFRKQMRILRDFMQRFDFIHMKPDRSVIKGGLPGNLTVQALVQPGRDYAFYFRPVIVTQFSARWTGQIEPKHSEDYTFHTFSNDGVRLWIDGRQLINNWTDHGTTEDTGRITLKAGKRHDLKLEYFYNGGQSIIQLWWSSQGQKKELVPSTALWLPDGPGHGLQAEYYQGNNFQEPWQKRSDAQINFTWGNGSPFSSARTAPLSELQVELPPGNYRVEWIDPLTGRNARHERLKHPGGIARLAAPEVREDVALHISSR
jgi:hypothetical protein